LVQLSKIYRAREGLVPDITPETATRQLADHLLGLRRVFGEEIIPARPSANASRWRWRRQSSRWRPATGTAVA
jgi:hypothetical protein